MRRYLINLDVNSAYYDPKTRSMRENPRAPGEADEQGWQGDNHNRISGDARDLAAMQLYNFEAYDKGQNLHLNADPTTVEMMNKIYREKKESLKSNRSNKILDKYGGAEHMEGPPKELLFAQTEEYVEYDRSGQVVRGTERAVAKSKYIEDVHTHNHTSIWGSYFDRNTFRWGYADDHSTLHNSYSTGEAGKRARDLASAAMSRPAAERVQSLEVGTSAERDARAKANLPSRSMYGMAEELGEQALDEAKVRAAMAAEAERKKGFEADDRKRKFNSMESDEVSAEAMEAYHRSKHRADDPMANFADVATDDEA